MTQFQLIHHLDESQILQLHQLFSQQWWTSERTLVDIKKMLASSDRLFAYWNREESKLVAFARLLTDNVYRAFIFDVMVDESLQGQGIGRKLITEILDRTAHIERVELYCKEDKVPFYEKLGFTLPPNTRLMRAQ